MTQTLLPSQPSTKALSFFNDCANIMGTLAGRWLDERQYEDINDYKKPLLPYAEKHGVTILKMNKKPFGCDFSVDGRTFVLKITAKGSYSYKRIA